MSGSGAVGSGPVTGSGPVSGPGKLPAVPRFSSAVETNIPVDDADDNKESIIWVVIDFIVLLLSLLFLLFLVNEYLTLNGEPLFSRPSFFNDLPPFTFDSK
jgi:hypothetical protein